MSDNMTSTSQSIEEVARELDYAEIQRDEAAEGLFSEEHSASTEEFVQPVTRNPKTGPKYDAISTFNNRYREVLREYNPEKDIDGYERAEDFLNSDKENALESLDKFEKWAENRLEEIIGNSSVIIDDFELDNQLYKDAVQGYGVRKLVNDKKNNLTEPSTHK